MIHKYYEVLCDYCGATINHYPERKPTNELLKRQGVTITATKQFCSEECYANYNHDRQQRQYLNLHPDGRINRE